MHADLGSGDSRAVVGDFPDPAAFRRLWIEPKITIDETLIFNLQFDVTSASKPINNLLLSYKGLSGFTSTGGNFNEPFSFEQMMSNNDTTLVERSIADSFSPARNTGFAIGARGTGSAAT